MEGEGRPHVVARSAFNFVLIRESLSVVIVLGGVRRSERPELFRLEW